MGLSPALVQQELPDHQAGQRDRRRDADGRAEREHGTQHRPPRLRAGDRRAGPPPTPPRTCWPARISSAPTSAADRQPFASGASPSARVQFTRRAPAAAGRCVSRRAPPRPMPGTPSASAHPPTRHASESTTSASTLSSSPQMSVQPSTTLACGRRARSTSRPSSAAPGGGPSTARTIRAAQFRAQFARRCQDLDAVTFVDAGRLCRVGSEQHRRTMARGAHSRHRGGDHVDERHATSLCLASGHGLK